MPQLISTLFLFFISLNSFADEKKVSIIQVDLNSRIIRDAGEVQAILILESKLPKEILSCWGRIEAMDDEISISVPPQYKRGSQCTIENLGDGKFKARMRYFFAAPAVSRAYEFQSISVSSATNADETLPLENHGLIFQVLSDTKPIPLTVKNASFTSEFASIGRDTPINMTIDIASSTSITNVSVSVEIQDCKDKHHHGFISMLESSKPQPNGEIVTVERQWTVDEFLKNIEKTQCVKNIFLGKSISVQNSGLQRAVTGKFKMEHPIIH